jgi:hypothetical protein
VRCRTVIVVIVVVIGVVCAAQQHKAKREQSQLPKSLFGVAEERAVAPCAW